jgi:hypothetical protein
MIAQQGMLLLDSSENVVLNIQQPYLRAILASFIQMRKAIDMRKHFHPTFFCISNEVPTELIR